MKRSYIEENDKTRECLNRLVKEISDKELKLVIYKEGWTVATSLAHLAFWDERRWQVIQRWREKGVRALPDISEGHTHIINDALLPFFLALNPRRAADLCVASAGKIDKEVEILPETLLKDIEATGDRYALNRGLHRQMHLEEIETLLAAKRGR